MNSQRKLDVSLPVGEKPRWELDHTEADKELNSISDRYANEFLSFFWLNSVTKLHSCSVTQTVYNSSSVS